jgi:replicative DNA helicase
MDLPQQNKSSLKTTKSRQVGMPQAKVPPQAIELEKAILGGMLIDKRGVDEVVDLLFPEVFYLP